MAMLGAEASPSTIAKNIKALKTQEQKNKAQLDLWLRGRDINKAEQEALQAISDAQIESAKIIESAKAKDQEASARLKDAQSAHKECEAELAMQAVKTAELNAEIEEAEAQKAKAIDMQEKLDGKIKAVNAEKKMLAEKKQKLKEALELI